VDFAVNFGVEVGTVPGCGAAMLWFTVGIMAITYRKPIGMV
jgi:hypothetical protein